MNKRRHYADLTITESDIIVKTKATLFQKRFCDIGFCRRRIDVRFHAESDIADRSRRQEREPDRHESGVGGLVLLSFELSTRVKPVRIRAKTQLVGGPGVCGPTVAGFASFSPAGRLPAIPPAVRLPAFLFGKTAGRQATGGRCENSALYIQKWGGGPVSGYKPF